MEHTVHYGETLSSIADRYGVTVRAIRHANNLQNDLIYPGQRLYIPVQDQYQPTYPSYPTYPTYPTQQHYHTHYHTHTHQSGQHGQQ
jgi:N-acetylmuramoyl-L-alanine amidase